MDRALAAEIDTIEGALRSTLDDMAEYAAEDEEQAAVALVSCARQLADKLTYAVDRLDDDDDADTARRKAAYLAANLAMLERRLGGGSWH
jgi:hypothetical protein